MAKEPDTEGEMMESCNASMFSHLHHLMNSGPSFNEYYGVRDSFDSEEEYVKWRLANPHPAPIPPAKNKTTAGQG